MTIPHQSPVGTDGLTFAFYQPAFYPAFREVMAAAYYDLDEGCVSEPEMQLLSELYPQGQHLYFQGETLVGAAISRVVPYEKYTRPHSLADSTDMNVYAAETAAGECLYCLDVFVNPAINIPHLGKMIEKNIINMAFEANFYAFLGVSRVTRYHKYADQYDIQTYVEDVQAREIYDPVLHFHLNCGMQPVCIAPGFCPDDQKSLGYGVVMENLNPDYDPAIPVYAGRHAALARFFVPVSR